MGVASRPGHDTGSEVPIMRSILKQTIALATWSATLITVPALADVGPADICSGEGTACDNAGPGANLPGICTAAKCGSPEPKPDGGIIYRDCLRCMPAGAGGAGAAGAGGGGTGGAGVGGEQTGGAAAAAAGGPNAAGRGGSSPDDGGGCSCRLSTAGTERALAATMLLVGLAALRAGRRKH
jgi:MYXO-CTERM domain-containing protein